MSCFVFALIWSVGILVRDGIGLRATTHYFELPSGWSTSSMYWCIRHSVRTWQGVAMYYKKCVTFRLWDFEYFDNPQPRLGRRYIRDRFCTASQVRRQTGSVVDLLVEKHPRGYGRHRINRSTSLRAYQEVTENSSATEPPRLCSRLCRKFGVRTVRPLASYECHSRSSLSSV